MIIQMNELKTFSELILLDSFEDRFNYLKLGGVIGEVTFGFDRYINQQFYKSKRWLDVRKHVIIRDNGNDLSFDDRPITGKILIHHINPITIEDIRFQKDVVLNPEFLISTSLNTHNAIHYGDESLLITEFKERKPSDTKLW